MKFIKGTKIITVRGTSKRKTHKRKVKISDKVKKGDKKIIINDKESLSKFMDIYTSNLLLNPNGKSIIEDVSEYTAVRYMSINTYLRSNSIDKNEKIDKEINNISSFLKDAPKMNGTVYRGMNFWKSEEHGRKNFDDFLSNIKDGTLFTLKSFTSTSIDEKMGSSFAHPERAHTIIFEIKSKNGVYLNGVSGLPEENEVLFDKKSKFNIIKVDKSEYPEHIRIIMEEI